ncbi:hypothetical protein BDW74DRAFT_68552 [Aspergillus multicolor]|uniref:uncharacterized protein n=1 Tax=Aspergillus multicolor TaxID=41759 RepID=UPI003CCDC75D
MASRARPSAEELREHRTSHFMHPGLHLQYRTISAQLLIRSEPRRLLLRRGPSAIASNMPLMCLFLHIFPYLLPFVFTPFCLLFV